MSVHLSITDADNGADVELTLNCATNNPIVSYQLGPRLEDYFLYGHVTVKYNCTNSSSSIVSYVYHFSVQIPGLKTSSRVILGIKAKQSCKCFQEKVHESTSHR